MRRTIGLLFALSLAVSTSGCLRDEIFPEPFDWKHGESFAGRGDTVKEVRVPEDAQRMRLRLAADFSKDRPLLGEQAGLEIRVRDPEGLVVVYKFAKNAETRDTFGGPVGGPWTFTVSDPGAGTQHMIDVEWYVPMYDDWTWWQVWRG